MFIFKSIDEKFEEIGFIKVEEDKFGVRYERKNEDYNYTHVLTILHKANGQHIIQSYDGTTLIKTSLGNFCVGLTGYEMKLALKKMKKIGLYSK